MPVKFQMTLDGGEALLKSQLCLVLWRAEPRQFCHDMLVFKWVIRNKIHVAQVQVLFFIARAVKVVKKTMLCKCSWGRPQWLWGFSNLQKHYFSVNRSKVSHKECAHEATQEKVAIACAPAPCVGCRYRYRVLGYDSHNFLCSGFALALRSILLREDDRCLILHNPGTLLTNHCGKGTAKIRICFCI